MPIHPLAAALLVLAPFTPGTNTASAQAPAGTTVSVPIHEGDPATVTGTLVLRHRAGKQFFILQSPTPYRLLFPLGDPPKVVRDLEIHLPGQAAALAAFAGKTITANGKIHLTPGPPTWNGALIECRLIILPGGSRLNAK